MIVLEVSRSEVHFEGIQDQHGILPATLVTWNPPKKQKTRTKGEIRTRRVLKHWNARKENPRDW